MRNLVLSISVLMIFIGRLAAQWVTDPAQNLPVAVVAGQQSNPRVIPTGDGCYAIVWDDKRSGNKDIYAQKLDWKGRVLWQSDGVLVCGAANDQRRPEAVPDGQGGIIVTWEDFRSGSEDIYAQRLAADGSPLWQADGVPVSQAAYSQNYPQIVSDDASGAFIIWESRQADGVHEDVYWQHVDSTGTPQFTPDGLVVCDAPWGQNEPKMARDGDGNILAVWEDWRADFEYPDIYAQKLSPQGQALWAANGMPVSVAVGEQKQPQIAADPSGNSYIVWRDSRNGNVDIYAQRLNPDGTSGWQPNGLPVCTAPNNQYRPHIIYDGVDGCIITWHDFRWSSSPPFNIDVYAQRISYDGTLQWALNGVAVGDSPANQIDEFVVPDGMGGAIVAWSEHPGNGVTDVYAQRIDRAGQKLWNPAGVAVGTASGSQRPVHLCPDGYNGAVVVWADERDYSQNEGDIYAQYLNARGLYTNVLPGIKINELYYAGPPNSSFFFQDQFVELVNTADTTLYLDGCIIARVPVSSSYHWMTSDSVLATYAFKFPGMPGEKNHPLAPEQFAVIAMDALDHSQTMPTAVNLVNADWEFYNPQGNDFDNVSVPNLLNMNPTKTQDFMMSLTSDYIVLADGRHAALDTVQTQPSLKVMVRFPTSSVLDGVEYQSSPGASRSHVIVDEGVTGGIPRYQGKSLQRLPIFADDNNSTVDFEILNAPTPEIPSAITGSATAVPRQLTLYQNYPNPFNPETRISFYLPQSEKVTIEIYDVTGRLVKKLVNRELPGGSHQVVWDGSTADGKKAASGTYFYLLKTASLTISKKMYLLK